MTADLAGFLRARLDEDEQAARAATPGPWYAKPYEHDDDADCEASIGTDLQSVWAASDIVTGGYEGGGVCKLADAHHVTRHDPARVLAEVDAKRRIIAQYEDHARLQAGGMGGLLTKYMVGELQGVLRLLALPYAAHPNYREEWRP